MTSAQLRIVVWIPWGLAVVLALAFLAWCFLRRLATDTHEGVSLDSTSVIVLDDVDPGRHRLGAVDDVPADYHPHIGRRLIARETDTQRIEYPR